MKYDITQWTVTRVQEHKENYLESRLNSDICLLSRCRHHHLDMVKQKFDHVFYKSYNKSFYQNVKNNNGDPIDEYNLVCATNFKPDSIEFFDTALPSYEYGKSQEGSGVISMTIGDLQTINFATVWDKNSLTAKDLQYFFNDIAVKDKCLVVGDLHEEPTAPKDFHDVFEKYGYDASHTDNLVTFSKCKFDKEEHPNGWIHGYRHDRIITKGLKVNDLRSYCKPISEGQAHWIIQYSIDSI